jgi:hypothetical protein
MEKDVGKVIKNQDTEIIIRVDDFGGRRGVTIREFVKSEKYTGFTKAGTRILAEQFGEFKKLINSIDEKEILKDLPVPEQKDSATFTGKKTFTPRKQSNDSIDESFM